MYENFGSVSSDWQPVYQTIMDAVSEVTPGQVTVDIDIPRDLEIYADPIIRKVFVNLIENAVRHAGAITSIRFSSRIEDDTLKIFCDDDGIGVPLEEKGHIFEQGYGKNTGVGLFLSKEILSITGLSIRECGVYGEGARFEISVPAGRFRLNTDMPSP